MSEVTKNPLTAAAATWNDPNESMESVNARIHDGVQADKLEQRADTYVSTMFELFPYIRLPRKPVCLEIGSGTGYVMEALNRELRRQANPPASISGLDIAENMLAKAKSRLGGKGPFRFLHYDGMTIPLPDASVDFIYRVAALQHVPKPYVYNLFFEMQRVIKPTGFVVVHLLSFKHLPEHQIRAPWRDEIRRQVAGLEGHWHHFYTQEELETVLKTGTGVPYVNVRESGMIWTCFHGNPPPLPKDFDRVGYLEKNTDVRGDPAMHWQEYGYREGRVYK